jgi:hypothetical protein
MTGTADFCSILIMVAALAHPGAHAMALLIGHKPICELVHSIAQPIVKYEMQQVQRQARRRRTRR